MNTYKNFTKKEEYNVPKMVLERFANIIASEYKFTEGEFIKDILSLAKNISIFKDEDLLTLSSDSEVDIVDTTAYIQNVDGYQNIVELLGSE